MKSNLQKQKVGTNITDNRSAIHIMLFKHNYNSNFAILMQINGILWSVNYEIYK